MTENEAKLLEKLDDLANDLEVDMYSVATLNAYFEECGNTIRGLLEEIQAYRAIGTIEECRVAVEFVKKLADRKMTAEVLENYMQFEDECVKKGYTFKSILEAREKMKPKNPNKIRSEIHNAIIHYYCPNCGRRFGERGENSVILFKKELYCQGEGCGQAIDWN